MVGEFSLGSASIIVGELFESIRSINAGTTVLLIDQNVNGALDVATRDSVLKTGRVVTMVTRVELLASDEIRKRIWVFAIAVDGSHLVIVYSRDESVRASLVHSHGNPKAFRMFVQMSPGFACRRFGFVRVGGVADRRIRETGR